MQVLECGAAVSSTGLLMGAEKMQRRDYLLPDRVENPRADALHIVKVVRGGGVEVIDTPLSAALAVSQDPWGLSTPLPLCVPPRHREISPAPRKTKTPSHTPDRPLCPVAGVRCVRIVFLPSQNGFIV